jgi:hypothetical protein
VKNVSEIVKGDLVGVDHGEKIKSLARVTRVDGDKVDLWIITGCYPTTFNRHTGFTDDYGHEARIVMLDEIPEPALLTILDIEEKSHEQSPDKAKEYQSQFREVIKSVLSFESDKNLKSVPDWKPNPNSSREGDFLWRMAMREQLKSKIQKIENGAAEEIKALEAEAAEYGLSLR